MEFTETYERRLDPRQYGAKVYIGNEDSAKRLAILQKHRVTRIVNCTVTAGGRAVHDGVTDTVTEPQWPIAGLRPMRYRFKVIRWRECVRFIGRPEAAMPKATVDFFSRLWAWIDAAVAAEESV